MVVEQQLAADRDPGKGEHGVHRPARDDPRVDDQSVGVEARHERHFPPASARDLGAQQLADGGREALDAHVFSSRFFAAGKRTLLRISR